MIKGVSHSSSINVEFIREAIMSEEDLSSVSGAKQKDISKGRPKDLGSTVDLEQLWDPQDAQGSLHAVFRYVAEDAKKAIEWYLRSKRRKICSMGCPVITIFISFPILSTTGG